MSRRISLSVSSKLKLKSFGIEIESIRNVNANLSLCLSRMNFSSKDGSGSKSGSGSNNNEDPFGVNFQDTTSNGNGNIGPKESLPPNYIRDSATGKFTGEIVEEASQEDKKMLNLGPIGQENLLKKRIEEYISRDDVLDKKYGDGTTSDGTSTSSSYSMANVARRIREEDVAFNTLGRKVTDLQLALESTSTTNNSTTNAAAPLSAEELASLHKFMEQTSPNNNSNNNNNNKNNRNNKHNNNRDNRDNSSSDSMTQLLIDESQELIPNIARQSSTKTPTRTYTPTRNINDANNANEDNENNLKDNPDMDLQWLSASAQRQMQSPDLDTEDLSDPFTNLMPSDLNPSKKINRRQAKPIPKQLIHHNNLSLLRRYVTPGGQIMNRTQSRLGAKDQRKVAKLVKRARHLGLIPVLGQWKFEDKGNVRDVSLMVERGWEERLVERGLLEKKSKAWEKMEMELEKKKSNKQGGVGGASNGW